eukprot:s234_g45.t1
MPEGLTLPLCVAKCRERDGGLEEQSRPMKKAPEWSLRIKHPPPKVDAKAVFGPGYDPLQVDLKWISHHVNKPEWTFPKEHARAQKVSNEKHALQDKLSSPPEVGPGKYIHPSSLHTQFPHEAERHRKQHAMSRSSSWKDVLGRSLLDPAAAAAKQPRPTTPNDAQRRPTTPKSARRKSERRSELQVEENATLHDAAWEGKLNMVRKFLNKGHSPDLPDEELSTPLHLMKGA